MPYMCPEGRRLAGDEGTERLYNGPVALSILSPVSSTDRLHPQQTDKLNLTMFARSIIVFGSLVGAAIAS